MKAPDFSTESRRRWLTGFALSPLIPGLAALPDWARAATSGCSASPDWTSFTARHIQADGRVVDFDTPQQQSTSEGQSYGLFFSLVHNDRDTFARVLSWTDANLAGNNLATRLPAWQWGRRPDGASWGVLDNNSASDSDLWIAYSLLEAGRLWNLPRYRSLGRAVLSMTARDEVMTLDGLGRMLLPWPKSVAKGPAWRLNPSYMPLQLLRYFQQESPQGPWGEIADNTLRLFGAVAPQGFAPDWCAWSSDDKAFVADPEKGPVGSYDAIRVYLWAGMLDTDDPARSMLLKSLFGPRRAIEQGKPMPEYVDTSTGIGRGTGPTGYAAALLPYLKAQGVATSFVLPPPTQKPLPYYERMLILFGQGWLEGRFAFGKTGQLQTHWKSPCPSARPT
ncbi:cellulose synthase complex periplasmic endoglucanase BcsZ [soil metagenome]